MENGRLNNMHDTHLPPHPVSSSRIQAGEIYRVSVVGTIDLSA